MPPESKFQVLRGFRPLARSLTVYNAENFRLGGDDTRKIRRNLMLVIGCTALFFSVAVMSSLNGWTCFLPGLEWSERAFNLTLMLCLVQQLVIFTAMTRKNQQITNALEQLQRTVDSSEHIYPLLKCMSELLLGCPKFNMKLSQPSKCSWFESRSVFPTFPTFSRKFSIFNTSVPWQGLSQSHAIYEQVEQRYSTFVNNVGKAFVGILALMYGLPLRQPIEYMIFNHPKPSDWILSYDFK